MTASGAAAQAGVAAAQLRKEEDGPGALGQSEPKLGRSWAGYEKSQENGKRDVDAVWAEKRIGLQIWFRILFQGFEFKIKGFKYF
jgi:hypothetical protein